MQLLSRSWAFAALLLSAALCAAVPAKPAGDCRACHPDFKAVLGATHPVVKAKSIAECLTCHGKPGQVGAENAFSVRIHRAHAAPDSGVACIVCHDFKAGRSFTVKGRKQNLGKPTAADFALCKDIMATLGTAKFMASGHVDKRIGCSGCHGATFPMKGDTVENEACLACHGSYEALAEKSRVKDPKGLNPHKSHLGVIACTVCHFGHQKSVVYCRDCHPKTTLAIPFDN